MTDIATPAGRHNLPDTDASDQPEPGGPCCRADAELRWLGEWLADNLPGAARDGETPAATVVRILMVAKHGVRMLISAAQHAVVPFVAVLRDHGLDVAPDGLTIPAKETPHP
jgi:hypothetical protein